MAMSEVDPTLERALPPLAEPAVRERDDATWLGLGASALLLAGAVALGGSAAAYLDFPAFLMVVGGTAAVTMISFPLDDFLRLPRVVATALFRGVPRAGRHARRLIGIAAQARRTGLFSLEDVLPRLRDDRFLATALGLAVDNTPPDQVERRLAGELRAALARHRSAADMLRRGGEVAPAMGLIGTLVGLVQMLANLSNPASIGPAMAVAILATLYGAVLANVILLPVAAKLDRNSRAEALNANLTIMTAVSIAAKESPHRLEETLNGVLPPAERVDLFD
jgi:chemotaxis protein MotA